MSHEKGVTILVSVTIMSGDRTMYQWASIFLFKFKRYTGSLNSAKLKNIGTSLQESEEKVFPILKNF